MRVNSNSRGGREAIFRDLTVGDAFGEFAAVDRQPRSTTLAPLSDCRLVRMTAERIA